MEALANWNEDRMGRLETLFRQGKSFSLIAAEIGVSRNAAIGKAHRMKLPIGRKPTECLPRPRSAVRHKRQRAAASAMKKVKPEIVPNHDYSCSILELTNATCRYPLWHSSTPHSERFYCGTPGADLAAGVPYCQRHSFVSASARQN
jgi:GcrA cell cycle regulator